jgi:hypothetical protein
MVGVHENDFTRTNIVRVCSRGRLRDVQGLACGPAGTTDATELYAVSGIQLNLIDTKERGCSHYSPAGSSMLNRGSPGDGIACSSVNT